MQNGRINPQAWTSLVPKRKLNSVNMTTGLWSEVLITKIRTRSITFTKAQGIIDSNFPLYDKDLQLVKGNHK
jgi:hypothetical protein